MSKIELRHAVAVVSRAEIAFGKAAGRADPYATFAEAGASSRLEALQMIQIVIADFYKFAASKGLIDESQFAEYANGWPWIVLRMIEGAPAAEAPVLKSTESTESLVAFLKTLDPASEAFWHDVSERIEVEVAQPEMIRAPDYVPPNKPWWQVW